MGSLEDEKTKLLDPKNGPLFDHDTFPSKKEAKKSSKAKRAPSEDEEFVVRKEHGILDMFRFATWWDRLLIISGSLFSFIHGAGFPLLSVIFGGMTDTFLGVQTSGFIQPPPDLMMNDSSTTSFSTTQAAVFEQLSKEDFNKAITTYALDYTYIGIAMFIASYAQIACWVTACERQVDKLRKNFFQAVLRQEISWFDQHQAGELTNRLNDDLERVREGIGDKFSLFIQFFSAFLSGFIIGFIYSWKLTLVMMSLTPILVACGAWMGKTLGTIQKDEQKKYAVAGGVAEEVLSCIRTVTAFNGQQRENERYSSGLVAGKSEGVKKYLNVGVGLFITFTTMFGSYALAFWYGSRLILEDPTFPRGTVFTVFFAVMSGSFSLGNAVPHFNAIAQSKGASSGILDILDNEPQIDPYSLGGRRPTEIKGKIVFHKVRFSYPTRKNITVLNDINFNVESGQKIAFVGASGCGKSTIINLLLRFYDPKKGKISLDGHDLRDLNVNFLRNVIGVVSQEPILFDGTLEENILLGNPEISQDRIIEATKLANAYNFIKLLPLGLSTRVGERGVQLSGGQKQRIAIARALVRDPRILLLDEATSALDTESEGIVQQALDKAGKGRTTIIIAHRLSTIRDADHIYVMNNGGVVEEGTHHELMNLKGMFYKMVLAQQLDSADQELESGEELNEIEEKIPEAENGTEVLRRRSSKLSVASRASSKHSAHSRSSRRRSTATIRTETQEIQRLKKEIEEEKVKKVSLSRIIKENRAGWVYMCLGFIGTILTGAVMPCFALFYSQIFSVYSEEGDQLAKDAQFWSCMFLILGVTQGLGYFLAIYFYGLSGENITKTLRSQCFENILRQDIGYFDDEAHSTGKITTRLATDAPNVRAAVGNRLFSVVSAGISLLAGIIIAFIFGWKLALVITAMVPIIILAGYIDLYQQMKLKNNDTKLLEEAGKTASESIDNVRTVQALTREQRFFDIYSEKLENPYRQALRQAHIYGLGFGFSQSMIFFMYAAAFRFGAHLIELEEMDPLSVFRVFFAISFTGIALGQASSFVPDIVKARLSAALLIRMIEHKPDIDNCSKLGLKPTIQGEVTFSNVHFNYPTRPSVKVLQGISFTVQPGKTLALVGPSGCGKSTVVSLLERFYDVSKGQIIVDGYNLKTLNLPSLRYQIGLVSQEPILFDCSIRDNIAYGIEGHVNHEEITNAAKLSNIHNFIMSLPLGYDTPVGEKGTQLSGGQKQRVAIARAIVRNPKILLLDEATSALDTESEKIVQEALDKASAGRTCIVIAHRLSTIRNSDSIAVIKDGKIIEQGTHSELIEAGGLYQSLTQKQRLLED